MHLHVDIRLHVYMSTTEASSFCIYIENLLQTPNCPQYVPFSPPLLASYSISCSRKSCGPPGWQRQYAVKGHTGRMGKFHTVTNYHFRTRNDDQRLRFKTFFRKSSRLKIFRLLKVGCRFISKHHEGNNLGWILMAGT